MILSISLIRDSRKISLKLWMGSEYENLKVVNLYHKVCYMMQSFISLLKVKSHGNLKLEELFISVKGAYYF